MNECIRNKDSERRVNEKRKSRWNKIENNKRKRAKNIGEGW
jgi:hypothetical protein